MTLQKLEDFFKYDLKIKEELHKSAPDDRYKNDIGYVSKYSDLLNETLKNLEFYMEKISKAINFDYNDYLEKLFKTLNEKLKECGLNYSKLKAFYNVCLSDMSEELIKKTKTEYIGFSMFNTYLNLHGASSINEILHVMHSYVMNNEEIYQSINKLYEKTNNEGYSINLYGKDNILARNIFDNYPTNIESDETNIVSLDNKIMIMVRDIGHALTIEISIEKDKCFVQYFIPKVCNTLMVNNLKGVNKVTKEDRYTIGQFETSYENLSKDVIELISNVPKDKDAYLMGGEYYEEQVGKIR